MQQRRRRVAGACWCCWASCAGDASEGTERTPKHVKLESSTIVPFHTAVSFEEGRFC